MSLYCKASYQGYLGKAWEFRRSPGLTPEFGWIDLDLKDVKKISLVGRDVPWRNAGGIEVNGPIDIRSWAGIRSGTTATPPSLPNPPGGGFNLFGDLILTTMDDAWNIVDSITYSDIYVAQSGLEEVLEELAEAERHDRGTIRVPLTDIRLWYSRCGAFFSGINVHKKSGEKDKTTWKDGGAPWSVQEAIPFLFSQLPGSPSVINNSELYKMSASPPSDVIGKGEPVVEHLQKMLDRYGLIPGLRPDGNYSVDRRGSTKFGYKQGPDKSGEPSSLARSSKRMLHYEKKTVTVTDRPPAVMVTGPRRIRRVSVPYVPVLEDTDGKIYRMEAVVKRWGYSMAKLNNIVMMTGERKGRDIPPTIEEGLQSNSGGSLHMKRVELAKKAYRLYAPAFLFEGDPESIEATATGLSDSDFEVAPYLPMERAPWYTSDLNAEGIVIPKGDSEGAGDREEFVLMPPIAHAQRFGSAFFSDFKTLKAYFDQNIDQLSSTTDLLNGFMDFIRQQKQKIADALTDMSSTGDRSVNAAKLAKFGAGAAAGLIEIGRDVKKALANQVKALGKLTYDGFLESGAALADMAKQWDQMEKSAQRSFDTLSLTKEGWKKRFKGYEGVIDQLGGMFVNFNVPYGLLEAGSYSVDLRTGILESSVPLCMVDRPVFFNGEGTTVVGDGNVVVTFGTELKDNSVAAFTSFLFVAGDSADDEPATPRLAGICQSSAIKPRCEAMNSRLYEFELGTPCNLNACFADAYQKAAAIFGQAKVVTGYIYTFSGMCGFPLAAGVTGVQHQGIGGGPGHTALTIRAPGSKALIGPSQLARPATAGADTRENLERDLGE